MTDLIPQTPAIDTFPAYVIHQPIEGHEYQDGDVIALPYQSARYGRMWSFYTLGSVAAYAASYGEDPVAAVEKAKARGHELFWANANSVSLTAWKRPQEHRIGHKLGDVIRFAGRSFRLDKRPNNNVGLVDVTPE